MELEHRALYNLLRTNWLLNPNGMDVEPWQVEDYRQQPLSNLFDRLIKLGISLDKANFVAYAEHSDSPEELTDEFAEDLEEENIEDQIYLVVFELWRRLVPEKPSLSIFCDELDFQIFLYDNGLSESPEGLQDAIANFEVILDENSDSGGDPVEIFESICQGCANDVESFLYDYIHEQLEQKNYPYAQDLLEGFADYVTGVHWFELLRAQLLAVQDPPAAHQLITHLIKEFETELDLEFTLALLAYLVKEGEEELFKRLVKYVVNLLVVEEDFQDLLSICIDYFHMLDKEQKEKEIQQILDAREEIALDAKISADNTQIKELLKLI